MADDKNIRGLARDKRATEEAASIRHLLNHFESLSVGIQNGIYDERMVKESWYTIVCTTYKQVLPYIEECRSRDGKGTYYQEFEQLAKRWESSPLATKKKWRQGAWKWFVW